MFFCWDILDEISSLSFVVCGFFSTTFVYYFFLVYGWCISTIFTFINSFCLKKNIILEHFNKIFDFWALMYFCWYHSKYINLIEQNMFVLHRFQYMSAFSKNLINYMENLIKFWQLVKKFIVLIVCFVGILSFFTCFDKRFGSLLY